MILFKLVIVRLQPIGTFSSPLVSTFAISELTDICDLGTGELG